MTKVECTRQRKLRCGVLQRVGASVIIIIDTSDIREVHVWNAATDTVAAMPNFVNLETLPTENDPECESGDRRNVHRLLMIASRSAAESKCRDRREVPLLPPRLKSGTDGAYSNFYSLHFMGVE